MRYRSRTDIVAEILRAANGGSTKVKIMNNTFLSYNRAREYIALLIANGLLEPDSRVNEFKTTEKGLKFLKLFEKIEETLDLMEIGSVDKAYRRRFRRWRFNDLLNSFFLYAGTTIATAVVMLFYLQDQLCLFFFSTIS
jgi:predicted transcriptional regulator